MCCLGLWGRSPIDGLDLRIAMGRYSPVRNRLLVFSTHDFAYHGHSLPLQAPLHRTRRSIALYFYSPVRRPDHQVDHRFRGKTTPSGPSAHEHSSRTIWFKVNDCAAHAPTKLEPRR